jgi:hypothetical protein
MTHSPNSGFKRSNITSQSSRRRWLPALVGALALLGGSTAWANVGTSTVLTVAPTSPASGDVISMKAVVTSVGVGVPGGTVSFTDTYNGVTETLGTVQVQDSNGTAGTALLETEVGGVGNHTFEATYNGDNSFAASSSFTQAVTFAGPYRTATVLSSTGTGPYTLTGTVSAFGPSAPTGNVTFTDSTTTATLGTAALNASSLQNGFIPYTIYPISNLNNNQTGNTIGPAIGDFNGDGHPDYAVPQNGSTSGGGGGVAILLGSGNGTFTNGTFLTTASTFTPTSVVVGDFNGDGKQDLAVLNAQGTGSVNIYLGNGDGTFQTPTNFPVATSASASRLLAVGDFNQDGYQDLVATNYNLNQVAVILGNGNGGFGAPQTFTVDSLPWNVVVGDVNHDGIPDLVVSSDGGAYASVLTGKGDGTFNAFTTAYTGASQVGSVAVGDFNGDGWPDIATTSAPDNKIYILLNQKTSTPSFASPVSYSTGTGSGVYYLTVGDFNRDGKLDIIAANNGNATVDLFLGNGDGTLQTPTSYSVGGNAIFATEGDINGDDRVDLTAIIDSGTPGLSVLLSGQTETATLSGVTINGCNTQSVVATYDGDSNYGTSTSSALTFTPTTATPSLTLAMSPTTPASGAQVTLSATLAPYAFGTTTSNGELVYFYNNGTLLGTSTLSSGVASFNYVMPNASYRFQAKYLGDCAFSASNSNRISGTPLLSSTITWSTPAPITYGTPLSSVQLDASDNAPGGGTYTYTPAAGTILPVGTSTLNVVFTPSNTQYGQEAASVNITVNPAQTYITWPTPDPISYGTPLSSFQLDATASTGVVNVPLGTYYNVYGIYSPGSTYNTGGFDNDGYSYSTTTLGGNVTWQGMTFDIGAANAKDAVANTTVNLPAGQYTNLYFLGAMVNNVQPNWTFTVNYTDGTNTTVTINLSDWFNAKGWPGESVISCSEDRNFDNGSPDPHSACLYGYDIALNSAKTVSNIVLPATRNIVLLSMNLTTPQIPGTFVYTPAAGTIEPVGTDTLNVTFTPSSNDYTQATGSVQLVVAPAVTPVVTTTINWPTPAPISYGTPLSSTQLDAVATGQARPTPVTPTSQLSVNATDEDGTSYNLAGFDGQGDTYSYNALNNGSITYAGATFTLGTPGVPDAITDGAVYTLPQSGNYSTVYLIGAANTTGQTNEPFVLTYSDGSTGTDTVSMSSWTSPVGYSGESTVAATTYADTKSGASVSGTHDLYGYQIAADPTRSLVSVTLPSTSNVVILALGFGSNQQVTVPGTYTYTPDAGTIEPVGTDTLDVSFTPTNTAAYTSATGSTTLVVNKATPVITWPTPTPVTVGTVLSGTQLDATAATPQGAALAGNFVYNPASGTVMTPSGTYTLNTTFTPTDTIDYTTATASVQLIVGTNGNSSLSGASAYADCCFFAQPDPYTITVGGVSNLTPTGTVEVLYNGNVIGSGTLATTTAPNAAASFLVSDASFYPGNNTVTLKYLGDSNYSPASTTATIVLRNPAITVNAATVGTSGSPTTIHYQFAQAGSININTNPAGASSTEFSLASSSTCQSGVSEAAGFDCTLVVNFTPAQPGTRRGVFQVNFVPTGSSQSEPTLYLFLSGISDAPQIALSSATQITLNSSLSQPQNAVFNPTDAYDATLYIANSLAAQLDTLQSSSGGSLTQWNAANTKELSYPADLTFDAFDNMVVPDYSTGSVYSYSPTTQTATTLSTGTVELFSPTQARFDLGGYLYISDPGASTPQIVSVPGQAYEPATLNLGTQSVSFPQALAVDNTGSNLYIGDGNTNEVLQVALNGNGGASSASQINISPCDATVTSCAFNSPAGFAFDPNGDMYVTDSGARVLKIPSTHVSSSTPTTTMPFTGLVNPTGITLDGAGNIYVTDVTGFITKLAVNAGAMKLPSVGSSLTTTVTNTGNLNLSISAITLGNGSNSSFTETDTCKGTSVAPGGTCTITVKYANATKGFDTLTITSNAFSQTGVTIALSY